jgi:hypothetical protein
MANRTRRLTDEENFRGDTVDDTDGNSVEDEWPPTDPLLGDETDLGDMLDPTSWGLDDAHDTYAMPDGTECQLEILTVTKAVDKNKEEYWRVRTEIVNEPYSKEVTIFIRLPNPRIMDAKQLNEARLKLRDFVQCFSIEMSGPFNPAIAWPRRRGWVILRAETSEEYGNQNSVKKFIVRR